MEISTKLHTIFLLIGPTECGKTTSAREVLVPGLQFEDADRHYRANVQVLSSDRIRQEILGADYDKYDQVMLEASEQAFHLLFERLKAVTSFPLNAEFVVVDTTGLSEEFRAKVREIAQENNYNVEAVVFDYRKREDYYASDRSKKVITNHLNRLRKEVLGSLAREGYANIHKIRAKDFYLVGEGKANPDYRVVIENKEAYLESVLPHGWSYIVIGDVHECAEDLQGLLRDHGFRIENGKLRAEGKLEKTKLILAGDWIDKGKGTRDIIEFLYENREHFYFVMGNHENFVWKYTNGEIKDVDTQLLETYFDSTSVLLNDPELLVKFRHLVSLAKPFYRYVGRREPSFYVTHAPCRNKYIGKLDPQSVRHQRNFRLNREEPWDEQLAFIKEEAVNNHPYHIFGHVAAHQSIRIGNKLHIDTGCVHGHMLTSVTMSQKPILKSRKAGRVVIAEELPVLFKEERKVSIEELAEEDIARLRYCSRNHINFISGTMSPADKDLASGELESLKRGLDHFRERNIRQVMLQPKYMGSRCNIYLFRELERCYAVSRNGYKINQPDLTDIYMKLQHKFSDYMLKHRISLMILDGELLPWKALGEGLIERQFKTIEKALETELAFLEQYGFEQAFCKLVADYDASGFDHDRHHLSKAALIDKYGSGDYQTYKHVHAVRNTHVPLCDQREAYRTYKKQLELYASDGELEYKPFAVLKFVYEDGSEEIPDWTTSEMFRFVSGDEALLLDLTEPDYLEKAESYYSRITLEKRMEGIVIKPEIWDGSVIPYMKVRNPEYLTIIYGYDYRFPHKYQKLIKQKSIKQKLRASLNEYRLGMKMLEISYEQIVPGNTAYEQIAANLLFEVAQEKEIDPRL